MNRALMSLHPDAGGSHEAFVLATAALPPRVPRKTIDRLVLDQVSDSPRTIRSISEVLERPDWSVRNALNRLSRARRVHCVQPGNYGRNSTLLWLIGPTPKALRKA